MRVEILDQRRGVLRVRIDSEDDLWLLNMLIAPGDLVKAVTTRDVSLGYEKRRIPMVLTVRVLKTEFQPFTNRLRIHGIVVEGPDRFGVKGSHHTINVDVGHEVTIFKSYWDPHLIDELMRVVKPLKILLVAIDFDEYSIALVQSQGIKVLDEKNLSLPISDDMLEYVKERALQELAKRIVEIAQRLGIDTVIIGSPGTLRDELKDLVVELFPKLKVYTDSVANGGYAGIQELLHRDIVRKVLEDIAITEASRILEEFNYMLIKNPERVTYGLDHVEKASSIGAIEKLVVTDEMVFSDEHRERIDKILREVVSKRGKVVIVPVNSPPGQHIKMLGGIIAILRYGIDLELIESDQA